LRPKTENFSIPFKKKKNGCAKSKKSGKNFHFWQSSSFSEKTGRRKRGFGAGRKNGGDGTLFLFFFCVFGCAWPAQPNPRAAKWTSHALTLK